MVKNIIEGNIDQNSEQANQLLHEFYRNILERDTLDPEVDIEIAEDGEVRFVNLNLENYIDNFIFNLNSLRVSRFSTFIFGTTEYGKLINLISYDEFPDELFIDSNEVTCKIFYYEHENNNERLAENDILRTFFIQMDDDPQNRKFYFQGNKAMMGEGFDELPEEERITEKLNFIKELSIIKEINGLTRVIKLKVDFRGRG